MTARDRLRSRAGQSLPEYALLLALLAIGLVSILLGYRTNLQAIYAATNNALASVASEITGAGGGGTIGGPAVAGGDGGGGSTVGGAAGSAASREGSNGVGGPSPGGGGGSSEPPPTIRR